MRNEYKTINGLATGIRAALKRQGVEVSKQTGKFSWTSGADIEAQYSAVSVEAYNKSKYIEVVTIEEIENALEAEGINFTTTRRNGAYGEGYEVRVNAAEYVK